MSSLTGITYNNIIEFRNPIDGNSINPARVLIAEAAFLVMIPIAIVEVAMSSIARTFACLLGQHTDHKIHSWNSDSVCALFQTIVALIVCNATLTTRPIPTPIPISPQDEYRPPIIRPSSSFPTPLPSNVYISPLNDHRKQLYAQYELGANATKVSELADQLNRELPNPNAEERALLRDVIMDVIGNVATPAKKRDIQLKLNVLLNARQIITDKYGKPLSWKWKERAIRMLWGIWLGYQKIDDDIERLALQYSLYEALTHCSARMSTEFENSYYKLAAPQLLNDLHQMRTAEERLIMDLTQYRMDLRDHVINVECSDVHNAASHKYYRKKLNLKVFHLPESPLCTEDPHWEERYARIEKYTAVKNSFMQLYNHEAVIRFFEESILKANGFQFDKQLFVQWLEENGKMNMDAFEDDEMTTYKPELIIEFLEKHHFIHKK
jgi:hypothetical protein